MSTVGEALGSLKRGEFVLVYDSDDRERETDLIKAAASTTPADLTRLRTDGGGLVFMMVSHEVAELFGLPFLADVFYREGARFPALKELIPNDIPYDAKSAFSVPINHRRTFTGITDEDRALTVRRFGELAAEAREMDPDHAQRLLGREFRAPGHVAVCRASPNPLATRMGHTELGIALVTMAGLTPVAVGAEMMTAGSALPKRDAMAYAEREGLLFLEGRDVVEAWREWSA